MERVTSTEDVKWCIGNGTQQGIDRSGSELALQEILKGLPRYPSVSSYLAQLGESTSTTATSEDKLAVAPYSTIDDGHTVTGDPGLPPLGPSPSSLKPESYSCGIPRASSLEVLKMLLAQPNLYTPSLPLVRQSAQHDSRNGNEVLGSTTSLNDVSSSMSLSQGGIISQPSHPAILSMNPAAAAAAALHFSQYSGAGLKHPTLDLESYEKSEQRRERRMLSNRESARRSRKRKQEHLHTLEEEITRLKDEKIKWLETEEQLSRRCTSAEEECKRLKEENFRLRDELSILGLVKSELFQSRKRAALESEQASEK